MALDLDGTLAESDHVAGTAMAAIKASRGELRMILVTGRIASDLEMAFPGLWGEFDAVVTENGAVLHTRSGVRPLADPVDPAVAHAWQKEVWPPGPARCWWRWPGMTPARRSK